MTAARLLAMWADGSLARLAQSSGSRDAFAAALGLSLSKLRDSWHRARERDASIPMLTELFGQTTVLRAGPAAIQPRTIADDLADRREHAKEREYKARIAELLAELEQTNAKLEAVLGVDGERHRVAPIQPREKSSMLREATAVALASDWHVEERVTAAQVNGVNEYDLTIAQHRVERYFSGLQYLLGYHEDHFALRDLLLWLGGDLITGYLREENLESNELSPVQAIATLHQWLATGIRSLLSTSLETVRIVCSSGNHGRLTDRVRASTREANSIEWLLYSMLAREFRDEPRIQFQLPQGQISYVEAYGRTIRFLHGDSIGYKGGVGGITIPLYKAINGMDTVRPASLTCLGHFHQYHDLPHLVVNGSLIGYSPYSMSLAARFEEPRQAFFLLDAKRGKTMPSDIWVADATERAA